MLLLSLWEGKNRSQGKGGKLNSYTHPHWQKSCVISCLYRMPFFIWHNNQGLQKCFKWFSSWLNVQWEDSAEEKHSRLLSITIIDGMNIMRTRSWDNTYRFAKRPSSIRPFRQPQKGCLFNLRRVSIYFTIKKFKSKKNDLMMLIITYGWNELKEIGEDFIYFQNGEKEVPLITQLVDS